MNIGLSQYEAADKKIRLGPWRDEAAKSTGFFSEDSGAVPSTHVVAQKHLELQFLRSESSGIFLSIRHT